MRIRVDSWKPHQKNTLAGFLDLTVEDISLQIKSCTAHRKEESRWIGLPGRQYTDEQGHQTFANFLNFTDKTARDAFQEAACAALREYLRGKGE